jgi:hypothetical protein
MSANRAEWTYALLLRAYPTEFRTTYGREMTLCFRDLRREAGSSGVGFWLKIIGDVARTAPALRMDAFRARLNSGSRLEERRMKPMGILTILIGLVQIANATIELVAGGAALAAFPRFVVLLAIAVAVLLVVAGVASVQRSPRAPTLATVAAVAWLALVVITRAIHPWMSIFTMLLATVFPVVLLVYVWMTRGRGTPRVA